MPPMDPAWLQLPERFTPARVTTSKALPPDTPVTLAQLEGPGCIRRIFAATVRRPTPAHQRQIILRMFWDGADTPAVEAPLGDFFGQLHGLPPYALDSRYLTTQFHAGYTATFPMPFQHAARIEVEAGPSVEDAGILMQIDWHAYPSESPPTLLRFHVQFRREFPARPTDGTTCCSTPSARAASWASTTAWPCATTGRAGRTRAPRTSM